MRPTSRTPSSCSGPSWRSPTSRGDPSPRSSDRHSPPLAPSHYNWLHHRCRDDRTLEENFFKILCVSFFLRLASSSGDKINFTPGRCRVFFLSVLTSFGVVVVMREPLFMNSWSPVWRRYIASCEDPCLTRILQMLILPQQTTWDKQEGERCFSINVTIKYVVGRMLPCCCDVIFSQRNYFLCACFFILCYATFFLILEQTLTALLNVGAFYF